MSAAITEPRFPQVGDSVLFIGCTRSYPATVSAVHAGVGTTIDCYYFAGGQRCDIVEVKLDRRGKRPNHWTWL